MAAGGVWILGAALSVAPLSPPPEPSGSPSSPAIKGVAPAPAGRDFFGSGRPSFSTRTPAKNGRDYDRGTGIVGNVATSLSGQNISTEQIGLDAPMIMRGHRQREFSLKSAINGWLAPPLMEAG